MNEDVENLTDEEAQAEILRLMKFFQFSRVAIDFTISNTRLSDGTTKEEVVGEVNFYFPETPAEALGAQEFVEFKLAKRLEMLLLHHGIRVET